MDYRTLLHSMGIPENTDLCANLFGIPADKIHENVILSPGWEPDSMPELGTTEFLGSAPLFGYKLWNIQNGDTEITYIRAGFGAPAVMDAALILGSSPCKRILFVSSVGALHPGVRIGDLILPEFSVSGDGASRYIITDDLHADIFGEKAYPNAALLERLQDAAAAVCRESNAAWHSARVFCTDTIFAQHPHIPAIEDIGCDALDMESAAVFHAAKLSGIAAAALLSVSDNMAEGKSLMFSGRGYSEEDAKYRRFVRKTLMPEIILRVFRSFAT